MFDHQAITGAMMKCIAPRGIPLTDQDQVNENLKAMLGEFGIDPDDAFTVGNMILAGAVAAEEPPEQTVVSSFVVGMAVGAQLGRMGQDAG